MGFASPVYLRFRGPVGSVMDGSGALAGKINRQLMGGSVAGKIIRQLTGGGVGAIAALSPPALPIVRSKHGRQQITDKQMILIM